MRCARLFRPHPALACHLPHPGEGSSRRFVTVRYSADFSVRLRSSADFSVKSRSRTEKIGTAERSLPPGGEGGAPATDEGETGERTIERRAQPQKAFPFEGEGGAMSAKPANVQSTAARHRCPAPAHSGFFPSAGVRRSFLYSLGEIPTSDRKAREKLLCPENPHFSATSSEVCPMR